MNQKKEEHGVIAMQALVARLISKKILIASDIVDTEVKIVNEERERFTVRTVFINKKATYIVKCARDKKSDEALDREVKAYRNLKNNISLKDIAPALIMYEYTQAFMVIEWIEGVNPVAITDMSHKQVAKQLGSLVGRLHNNTFHAKENPIATLKPYILTDLDMQKKWEQFPELNINIAKEQKDVFISGIQYARDLWEPDALIHGDLKWEHCILSNSSHDGDFDSLRVIDWELATFGDSAWDVACIVSDMILNMQYKTEGEKESVSEAMQSEEIRIFLQSYAKERVIEDHLLEHVSFYLGVRLFQTALELVSVYGWENKESKVDILLPMAVNIFNDFKRFSNILKHRLSE